MAWLAGYPREEVEWYPTIDTKKCLNCGMCMNCGKKVYDWTEYGPVVSRPFDCQMGCNTCANLCQGNAIRFPEVQWLRELYKKEGIWKKVKQQLIDEGKITLIK